ncbi:DUF1302 family protein [Peristeroidobacter agariperforans]|uniref:DUF1302 family protein n=1 Tax=Peristeroidobacter agariperforans TaxID=268404 RepID=UPI002AC36158|nr:DUF1302 family protein [Peristeroidobacter agariperforans]
MRALVLALSVYFASDVNAGEIESSVRASTWSSSRALDDESLLAPLQVWLRADQSVPTETVTLRFYTEGWAELEARGAHDDSHWDGRVREAYGQLSTDTLEIRAGIQIIAWGRADAINPTDNLAPRQLTLLTREPEDQRFGVPALRMSWYSESTSASIIWLAGFEPSELPLPPGAPFTTQEPENESHQWAARLEYVGGEFEGSLSWFNGYDVLPSQALPAASPLPIINLLHERVRIAGLDFAKTIGRFGVRAEAAYSSPVDAKVGAIFARQPQWYVVAGGDRTFGEYLNVNLQTYYRNVTASALTASSDPSQLAVSRALAIATQQFNSSDFGLSFRISNQWLHETLEVSISAVASLTRSGHLLRPVVRYRFRDNWSIAAGAEIFGGSNRSAFGALQKNCAGYVELRRGF